METRSIKLKSTIFLCSVGLGYLLFTSPIAGSAVTGEQTRRAGAASGTESRKARPTLPDYSNFSHNTAPHKLACDSCHKFPSANWNKVRTSEAAFPDITDYPQHPSCIGCHRQQFFSGAQPVICRVCHTNPSPRDSSRHPFPNPAEIFNASKQGQAFVSEFGVGFPHDKHVDLVGLNQPDETVERGVRFLPAVFEQEKPEKKIEPKGEESEPKSCAVCHKTYLPQGDADEEYVTKPPKGLSEDAFWLKKGAFKTMPTHAVCFTCHAQDGLQPSSSDCGACHKLLPPAERNSLIQAHDDFDPKLATAMGIRDRVMLEKWSARHTGKFRHEWISHASLSCTACHNISTLNTLDKRTRTQVKSCAGEGTGCHIESSADGILNLEIDKKRTSPAFQCSKCHVLNGKKAAPESHIGAIPAAQKK